MKRSEINEIIRKSIILLDKNNMRLPLFAYWKTDKWKDNKEKIFTISKVMQGWDVTDFGSGKFDECGAVLFTIRNGDVNNKSIGTPYAEKLIILLHENEQKIPMHCHRMKTEDIINRGGGTLCVQLYASDPDGNIDKTANIEFFMDGIKFNCNAGKVIEIDKGNSITITPGLYHAFWAKKGGGDLLVGEVSSVNDDNTDNVFAQPTGRFAVIEEDEDIEYPLANEYNKL